MDNEALTAKGLLLGHRDDIVKDFVKKRFFEKDEFSDRLRNIFISRNNSTWVYENISDILFELYQKTGIDLYYDDVYVSEDNIQFTAKYVDDNDEVKIEINWR